jgi:formyltetrahydrofolate dehydrogenase
MDVTFPHQLFINNEFVDASDGQTFDNMNPSDESLICKVSKGSKADVDKAVNAARVRKSILNREPSSN